MIAASLLGLVAGLALVAAALVLWLHILPELGQAEAEARTQAEPSPLEQRGLVPHPRRSPAPRAHQLANRNRALARRRVR